VAGGRESEMKVGDERDYGASPTEEGKWGVGWTMSF